MSSCCGRSANLVFVRGAAGGWDHRDGRQFAVLLAPYCLAIGYLLTLATRILSTAERPDGIGRVYFLDNLGGIAGGLAFAFLLVPRLNHVQILCLLGLVNLLAAGLIAWTTGRRVLSNRRPFASRAGRGNACLGPGSRLGGVPIPGPDARLSRQFALWQPDGDPIVRTIQLHRQRSDAFRHGNIEEVEQAVHFAMAQRPDARRVLLIGGGVAGTAREILKYPNAAVDYVEVDPLVLAEGRKYLPENLADPRDSRNQRRWAAALCASGNSL